MTDKKATVITFRASEQLIRKIDFCAKERNLSRSSAITLLLENSEIYIVPYGLEILNLLTSIDILLKQRECYNDVLEVCNELWRLLSLITESIPGSNQHETN